MAAQNSRQEPAALAGVSGEIWALPEQRWPPLAPPSPTAYTKQPEEGGCAGRGIARGGARVGLRPLPSSMDGSGAITLTEEPRHGTQRCRVTSSALPGRGGATRQG